MELPIFWKRYYRFNRVSQPLYEATWHESIADWLHETFWRLLPIATHIRLSWRQMSNQETHFYSFDCCGVLTTLAPLLPLVVSFPTYFVNESDTRETMINQASHHSQEYLEGISNPPGDVSFNRSSNPFLLPSPNKSVSRYSPTLAVDKILMPVEEVKGNTNVPWLSTLFIFMTVTWPLTISIGSVVLSLQNLATITYLKEKRYSFGSYFMWTHIGVIVSLFSVGLLASYFRLKPRLHYNVLGTARLIFWHRCRFFFGTARQILTV